MKIPRYIGIDIGTSAVKVVAVDDNQTELGAASVPVVTERPRENLSEQQAESWWDCVIEAMTSLWRESGLSGETVQGVGLTGQMHGLVLLGEDRRPLRSVILWNDGRAEKQAHLLGATSAHVAEKVGVLPMSGLTGPKVLWLEEHEPDLLEKARWLLSPKDYIGYRLTGDISTDYSDAAGTWLLNQERRRWSREAADVCGLPFTCLPDLQESTDVRGTVSATVAGQLGIPPGVPVAAGGGDTPVGAVGLGCVKPGSAVISLGTSAHIFTPTGRYMPAVDSLVHSFCHALPGLWYQMGAMLNGASALGWFGGLVGREAEQLDLEISVKYKAAGDSLFLPYLTGERTPHNDPMARGVFFGLKPESSRATMGQAVMEGVAFSIADGRDALMDSGTEISAAVIAGGGARSRVWAQIISSVLEMPIMRCKGSEQGPAFGAARLAMLAVGRGRIDEVCREPEIEDMIEPDNDAAGKYREMHDRFKRLYTVLRPEFRT